MIDQKQVNLLARLFGWLAVIAIGLLSLVPGDMRPHTGAPGPLEHVAAYIGAAGLLTISYKKMCHTLVIVLCLSIYSAVLEIAQIQIPGRHAAFFDFAASTAGSVIGSALAWIVLRALPRDFA